MAITVDLIQLDGATIPSNWNIGVANFVRADLKLTVTSPHNTQVIDGEVYKNGSAIARFNRTNTGILTQNWFAGARQPIYVNDGDVISVKVVSPITVQVDKGISRGGQDIAGDRSYSSCIKKSEYFLQGEEVPPNDVLEEVIDKMKTYTDISYTQRPAENVSNVVRYVQSEVQLPPITINIYNNSSDLQDALSSIRPVTQQDIFNTWPRFMFNQNGGGQNYWIDPKLATGEASHWTYNASEQRVQMPTNTDNWNGFLSLKKYDRYDHECTIGSSNSDDDWNGVVIAHNWSNNVNNLLFVNVSTANNLENTITSPYSTSIIGHYSASNLRTSPDFFIPNPSDPRLSAGWSGRTKRIRAIRRGDDITVDVSDWNSQEYSPPKQIKFNLNDDPSLSIFKGPQSYGYINLSQAGTYYKDLFFDGGERTDTITYAPTGEVYTYNPITGWVVEQGLSLTQIYGAPRELISETTGQRFMLNVNGTITPII